MRSQPSEFSMRPRNLANLITIFYILLDILFSALAMYLAFFIRQGTVPFGVSFENFFLNEANPFRSLSLMWTIVIVFANHGYGLYRTRREISEPLEIWDICRAVLFSTMLMIILIYGLKIEKFPRVILVLTAVFMTAGFSFWRIIKRYLVNYLVVHGYNNFNVLVIGADKVGQALVGEIAKHSELGLRVVGFLDDLKTGEVGASGLKVLGRISDFSWIAPREFVNKIFITVHHDTQAFLNLLQEARDLGIAVRVIPQGFEITSGDFTRYNIGFIPVLEYGDNFRIRRQAGKRFFDLLMGTLFSILAFPFLLLIAIMIWLDSPGPVVYRSRRYGRNGKIFNMYKFRSMVMNADDLLSELKNKNEADGPIFKIRQDPRVTRVGKFLRRYSLDELPQLFNVLKGDMSLVGPRPFPIAQIEKEDLRQLRRLEVRPGITGLWQIRGRSDVSFEKLVGWDIWYINNWSFWLDMSILIQTIPVAFKGRGAY